MAVAGTVRLALDPVARRRLAPARQPATRHAGPTGLAVTAGAAARRWLKPPLPGTNGLAAARAPHRFGIDVSGLRSVPPPDKQVFTGRDDPDLPV